MKKVRRILNLIICFSLLQLTAYGQIKYDSIPERKHSVRILKNDIQGTWRCFYSVYDSPLFNADATGPYHFETPETAIFEGDSLFEFNYPCELINRYKFELMSDSLLTNIQGKYYLLELTNDTLTLYTYSDNMGKEYTLKHYVRSFVKSDIINLLKKKNINPDCLQGKWNLRTESNNDDGASFKISYPFRLPGVLSINNKNINSKMIGENLLLIRVGCKNRPFYIHSFSEDNTKLFIIPGNWWNNEHVIIEYDQDTDD